MKKDEKMMTPVLKWAGGKKQLMEFITSNMPSEFNTYYEPFIGGAAVLLNQMPQKAVIGDVNEQLVNLYTQIKNSPDALIEKIKEMDLKECDKKLYYEMREKYNAKISEGVLDAECAALMIWINKHCFNGLYRVNSKGLFNVPYNNRVVGDSIDEDNIRKISSYLNSADVKIVCSDFEKTCESVQAGDFVYFDSPYVPESETASFTDYTKDGFEMEDHERLAELFKKLDGIGAKVMLSNNDVQLVRDLYKGFNIHALDAKRMINSKAGKRVGKEVLITNY